MIHFKIYNKTSELPDSWNALATHDILLQTNYLKALEQVAPDNISMYYVSVFKAEELVGIAMIQRVQLYFKDVFRNPTDSAFTKFFKNAVAKLIRGNILVVGNLTHTGQHGLVFNSERITYTNFLETLQNALKTLETQIKRINKKNIRIVMFKDYFKTDTIHKESIFFTNKNLNKVTVQPNMIMAIDASWKTEADYVSSLKKKYRSRFKTARKKRQGILCEDLDLETIKIHSKTIYALYKNVSNNAKINTFLLPENHFYNLKSNLKDDFKVFGYFLDDELIGFYTLILNNKTLETYFLGYDAKHQYKNQMYLNMLYDMLTFGIDNKFTAIVYARTAMEIKSSVGAKPEEMFVYMKHTNPIANAIFSKIFKLMNPHYNWEERHPFK